MIFRNPFASPTVKEIDPSEAYEIQMQGALLVDVREPHEWQAGHAPSARLIPLGELSHHLRELPSDGKLLFICRSGHRSALATEMAQRAGLTGSTNIRGGMVAWAQAGLPIEA